MFSHIVLKIRVCVICDVYVNKNSILRRRWDLKNLTDLHKRQSDKWMESSRRDFTSPRGFPKEMGSLGSDGSLSPCLLTERTLKRYCLPLTRSNTGNRGDDTTTSKLASSQLLLPTRDWGKNTGNEHGDREKENFVFCFSTWRACLIFNSWVKKKSHSSFLEEAILRRGGHVDDYKGIPKFMRVILMLPLLYKRMWSSRP